MTDTGTLPTLFFAHANGFPAGSYRQFLAPLERKFRIVAPDALGHNPDYPIAPNWHGLADELLDEIAADGSEKVVGVGHSLGGVLMFLAALRQPRRFHAFVMLDPPILFGWPGVVAAAAKRLGTIDRLTPAGRTRGRRSWWPDRETALADFRGKPLFRRFTQACLRDYVDSGTVESEGGVRLRYDPDVEVEIFRHIPHALHREPAPVRVKGAILAARDGNVMRPGDLERMRRRHHLLVREVEGGHMFPMERPEGAAAELSDVIRTLLDQQREQSPTFRGPS